MSRFPLKPILCFLISLLPACKIGFVSFGDKQGNLYRGDPVKAAPLDPIAEKFLIEIASDPVAVVPFSLGACSGPIKVKTVTKTNVTARVRVRTQVKISNISPSKLFADPNCGTLLPTDGNLPYLTIEKAGSEAEFYFKDAVATTQTSQTLVARANSPGYLESARTLRVDRTLVALGLAGNGVSGNPLGIGGGSCQGILLWGKDGVGQPFFPTNTSLSVGLSGSGSGSFYREANCTSNPITSVDLNSPNGILFYYKNNQVNETITIITSNNSQLINASLSASILSVPVRFRFRSPLPSELVAGICQPYTVEFIDSANGLSSFGATNSTISLAAKLSNQGTSMGDLFRGASCQGNAITTITPTGATDTSVTFSFKANSNVSHDSLIYFEASKSGLVSASTFSSLLRVYTEVRRVTFSGEFTNPRLGLCNSLTPLTVSVFDGRVDSLGTDIAFTRGTTVRLSKVLGGAGSARFFSDPQCENEFVGGTMPISSGSFARSFYYRDDSVGELLTVTLKAAGPEMTGGQIPEVTKTINLFRPLLEDFSFGNNGVSYVSLGQVSSAEISHFTAGNSGKILAVGTADRRMIALRVSSLGIREYLRPVVDPVFSETTGYAVAIDGSGSVVAGSGLSPGDPLASPPIPAQTEFVIAKLDSTGTVTVMQHGSFDPQGLESVATAIIKIGTKYISLGHFFDGFSRIGVVALFNSSLVMETVSGLGGGQLPVSLNAVDSNSFFVLGNSNQGATFSRYDLSGSLLCSNALSGVSASAATFANGKLYVASRQTPANTSKLFRVLPNCLVDSSFGTNGFTEDTATGNDETKSISVYPSNPNDPDSEKILVVGSRNSQGNKNFFLARYTKMGFPDGPVYFRERDLGSSNDTAFGAVVSTNGKILWGGISGVTLGVSQLFR